MLYLLYSNLEPFWDKCVKMQASVLTPFEAVCEEDNFLSLFPHRFDYIWAEHPAPGAEVEWRTESRHPLSDRLIQQGSHLYGVRFGSETRYALLDIDAGSAYHPKQDPFAVSRITAALEPLGLVSSVSCTSSYSGGLHLYFPFQQSQSSWQLAIVLNALLENAGFKPYPGQLEIFPNPKPFAVDGAYSLFNAHRLPLQTGSYLLNTNWQPIWSDRSTFAKQWQFAQERNDLDSKILKRLLKQVKRRRYGITGKAGKFLNDLNAEIELGWTGPGQTNRLLGRIAMRSYIFHHVFSGGDPLAGQALVNDIVQTARSLPGYEEWCRHQHEIQDRAEEWARCIENSRYFHFGYRVQAPVVENLEQVSQIKPKIKPIERSSSWNQQQSQCTRDRIKNAIADLLEKNSLPVRPTARFQALLQYGIGGGSLYRHRDLWHPSYFDLEADPQFSTNSQPVENPPHPPCFSQNSQLDHLSEESNWLSSPSLFPINGGNRNQDKLSSNSSDGGAESIAGNRSVCPALSGFQYIRQVLSQVKAQQEAQQEADQQARQLAQRHQQQIRSQAHQRQQIDRMQQYLRSGDPILMAEARAWAGINPGLLDMRRSSATQDK